MPPTPHEIKEKLLRALNGDNNVVDDKAVLEVISILETYPITRATLEQTRIGKTVNELRKKVKDEKLAKRAKQLVRSWKNILDGTATVVNGEHVSRPAHPGVAAAQVSPAGSPALSKASAGRGVSPALARDNVRGVGSGRLASPAVTPTGKPLTPGFSGKPLTPRLSGKPLTPGLSGKPLTPGFSGKPLTPGLSRSRVASPALSGGKPGSTTISQKSPALAGSKPRTPLLASTSRVASPGISYDGSSKARIRPPSTSSSPALSPASRPSTPAGPKSSKSRLTAAGGREDAGSTGRLTPSSLHSDNSQDRVLGDHHRGERGNGTCMADSDSESNSNFSSGRNFSHRNNHSAPPGVSSSLSKSANKGSSSKDQRDLSKANVANRKRTREHSESPPEVSSKQSRLESSSGLSTFSSGKHERGLNGCVKSGKKTLSGPDLLRTSSTASLPTNLGSVSSPKSPFPPGNGETSVHHFDGLPRQESTDSRLSAQSFDRPSRDKHKVKTTEQLIEELQKKNNSSRVGARIINDLRTNQIEKERDVPRSVLPPGMKRRGRKGKDDDIHLTVPSSDVTLSQAKNELVERFLETSDPSSTVEEYSPFKDDLLSQRSDSVLEPSLGLGAYSSSFKGSFDSGFPPLDHSLSSDSKRGERKGQERVGPSGDPAAPASGTSLTLDQIYAQLPPVDDNIDWEAVDFFELPEPEPVTEEVVDRLHTREWAGVNGLYDVNGDWHPWQRTLTLSSYQGDNLHILPYVDLD